MTAPTPAKVATLHPVRKACIDAATKLVNLTPTKIVGEPNLDDARSLIDDIEVVAAIIDPIFAALGQYAESHFGKVDQSLFTECAFGAIDGQATYEIECAAKRYLADRGDGAAEQAAELRRA